MATYKVTIENKEYGIKMEMFKGLTKEQAEEKKALFVPVDGYEAHIYIEMNQHEKVINQLIMNCVSEWIGGLENTMLDYEEGSEEYENAKQMLNHDELFDMFYSDIMVETRRNYKSHLRFAGKAFIEERIEKALKKNGYGKKAE